ncbi:MAG: hypothetical protein JNM84_14175 [Planctomycetes bacterium]|nr:hypothetical protein [Planctomycetota bacterium]
MRYLLPFLTSAAALSAQQPTPLELPDDARAALAAAMDLPTREQRRAASAALAARDLPLERWLAIAASWAPAAPPPGEVERIDERTTRHRTRFHILGAERPAEILVRTPTENARGGPLPLLFCWHEAGGSGETALQTWASIADRHGLLLAAPTETYEPYRRDGWSYMLDAEEGAKLALRFVRRRYDIDEDRIFLAGMRGGGHMVWDLGLRHPDLFAGLLPANGSPRLGNAEHDRNLIFLESLAGTPLRSLHWGPQEPLQAGNVRRALAGLQRYGARRAQRLEFADQDAALQGDHDELERWFAQRREVPQRLVRIPETCWFPPQADCGRLHWLDILRVDPQWKTRPTLPTTQARGSDVELLRDRLDRTLREQQPRLSIQNRGDGRYDVEDRYIHGFRLLLTPAMVGRDGHVEVRWRGHVLRKAATPSSAVLLSEFLERFDRSFLPTAEVVVP